MRRSKTVFVAVFTARAMSRPEALRLRKFLKRVLREEGLRAITVSAGLVGMGKTKSQGSNLCRR